tara:strand:- start:844 stop:1455 length:612 start_codon:yes stop_codon:yes gene_type:complete
MSTTPLSVASANQLLEDTRTKLKAARVAEAEASHEFAALSAAAELGDADVQSATIQAARKKREECRDKVEAISIALQAAEKRFYEAQEADRAAAIALRWNNCRNKAANANAALKKIEKLLPDLDRAAKEYIELASAIREESPFCDQRPDAALQLSRAAVQSRLMRHLRLGLLSVSPDLAHVASQSQGFGEERRWLSLHSEPEA